MSDPIEAAAGALDVIFAEQLENVRTCTPLVVTAFTPGGSALSATCECQPAVPDTLPNGNPGKVVPVLSERPVWYPGGGGTFIYWPVVTGDVALGLVSDRSLAAWSLSRTPGLPSAPELPHFHQISDTQVLPLTDRPGIPDGDPGLATDLIMGTAAGVALRIAGATGEITITTPAATVTVAVDGTITLEGPTVNVGGLAAVNLPKWPQLEAAVDAMLAAGVLFVGTPADPSGENAGAAFAAAQAAWEAAKGAVPTTKAKGE
jgi:hypothetical protein